ncbi:hypothetical protein Clacol_001107 [Clathrus columnatus]|uniref:Alpha/beta hydrolase fold-3 domain-containing protein n=1 Tax=Clathrus columnatus TaxID=1419009 RepID=A0AAV5A1M6_9AGAM|nr:hypothetical protein Clacol_001107 [Clathrus columnatus]
MTAYIGLMYKTKLIFTAESHPLPLEEMHESLGLVMVDPVQDEFIVGFVRDAVRANSVIISERVPGYWWGDRGKDGKVGQPAAPGEKVLLAFHAGGFVMGTSRPKGSNDIVISDLLTNSSSHFTRVFAPDYRLASSAPNPIANPFPGALLDALASYLYLLKLGFTPNNIIVFGDSSGGTLSVLLTRYIIQLISLKLKFRGEPLQTPSHVILVSPSLDWSTSFHHGPESSYVARSLLGSLPPESLYTNAWLSPASLKISEEERRKLYAGFPNTYIAAGEFECSIDPMKTFYEWLKSSVAVEVSVEYDVIPKGGHDIVAMSFFEPERTELFKRIDKWLTRTGF